VELEDFTRHIFPLKEIDQAFAFALSRKGLKAILQP
jgi:hypothetical protein